MAREIATVDYSSDTQVLTVVFMDGNVYQERDVESVREAREILKIKFPFSPEKRGEDERPRKFYGHLRLY